MSSPKVSKVILFIIAASSFLTPFLASSVTRVLKVIGTDFSLSSVGVGWIVSSYLLAAAVFMVPVGKLADIHGQKIFFSAGCLIITVTSLLCGLAPYAWVLMVSRIQSSFAFSSLAALINYSATFAVTFIIALYLQCVKGFSPQYTGVLLMSQPAVMAFISPIAGRLSDYKESRIIASIGMLLCVCALMILTLLTPHSSIIHVIIGLVVLGFGCVLFSAPNTAAVMSSVEKKN
jgi:MFS family permease